MKSILSILGVLLFSASAFGAPELKGTPSDLKEFLFPEDKTVVISAVSNETAYTDKATVSLVITVEEKTLSSAISSNTQLRERIVKALTNKGISQEKIKRSKFSSSSEYGWFGKKMTSFKVVNRVVVSIVSEANLELVAKVADEYEGVVLASVVFEHSKKDAFVQQVKAKALANIMQQKKHYEQNLGFKLTAVDINESRVNALPTDGAGVIEEVVVSGVRGVSSKAKSSYSRSDRATSFDEVNYVARLSVEFKIEP